MNPSTPQDPQQQPNVPQENFENPITTPPQHPGSVETGQQEVQMPPAADTMTPPEEPSITHTPPAPAPTEPAGPTGDTLETSSQSMFDAEQQAPMEPIQPPSTADTAFTAEPQPPAMPAADQTQASVPSPSPMETVEADPLQQPHNPPTSEASPVQGTPMPDVNVDEKIRQNGDGATMTQPQAMPEKKGNWFTRLFGGGK